MLGPVLRPPRISWGVKVERVISRSAVAALVLYHFDWVFTILEISLSEKAEKFSFSLWRFLKWSFFSAVTLCKNVNSSKSRPQSGTRRNFGILVKCTFHLTFFWLCIDFQLIFSWPSADCSVTILTHKREKEALLMSVPATTADCDGYNLSAYALAILVHIYNRLINMRCLHILPHI